MSLTQLKVEGMSCEHCQTRVHNCLLELPGVKRAEVDLVQGTVTVNYDENQVNLFIIRKRLKRPVIRLLVKCKAF